MYIYKIIYIKLYIIFLLNNFLLNQYISSMFDFCNINSIIQCKSNKSVKFNDIIKIYLVPSREDYIKYDLKDKIWYSENDYKLFIKENII